MAEVVDHAKAGKPAVAVEIAHFRENVSQRRVAYLHEVEWPPNSSHVVGEALVDPKGDTSTEDRTGHDVERKLMS